MTNTKRSWSVAMAVACFVLVLVSTSCKKSETNEAKAINQSSSKQANAVNAGAGSEQKQLAGPSLVALSAGAYVVKRPSEWMESESAYALLDENPQSKWA